MAAYCELRARSAFSFLRGASSPEALVTEAARLGLPALALVDRDNLCGAPRAYAAARAAGLRARVGAEITLADGSVLPLLAASRTGYRNLCRLITEAKLTPRPAGAAAEAPLAPPEPGDADADPGTRKRPCLATWEELAAHAEGLVALTGDEDGPVLRAWRREGVAAAGAALARLEAVYGRQRLHVELQRTRRRGEERAGAFLRDLAAARGLPLLATGGADYATPDGRAVADVFTCLRHHTTLDAAGRLLSSNGQRHLRGGEEMAERFADLPGAVAAAGRLEAELDFTLRDLGYRFPDFPVGPGETMAGVLRARTYAGARERYGEPPPRVRAQLDRELALIEQLGFCGYFLIVWDLCRHARAEGILVQGRGSAANSAVCYTLGITAVDPIRHRLLFERFLSEGRVGRDGRPSWPDIDLDFPSGEPRERAIRKVYADHGPRGAAMTANVITYRGRGTLRELGKVLGFSADVLDRFSALQSPGDFPDTLELRRRLELAGVSAGHPRAAALTSLHGRIRSLPRHLGQHSGGMVVCGGRLDEVAPLEPAAMPGRVVVQWDKAACEDLGIVKVDLLGLGMMAVLQDTLALCRAHGAPLELHTIPADDPATYAAMQRADTVGVFQIESRAQMATLPRLRPACFYDVAMQVAIVRPGPIVGNLAHPLIRRRNGQEPVTYLDPSVEEVVRPVLERTLGVILFQEQLLELAMRLADLSGGEAEELRRALGFTQDPGRLTAAVGRLGDALRARGRNEEVVRRVCEAACSFALYGFPESHALSFALLAYASTWLKVHRPAEFTASLLNHQPMGFYGPATLLQDARRHGLKVRPVCAVRSRWECTVEGADTVRLGLRHVRGLREAAARALVAARECAPFRTLADCLRRAPLHAAERRALATAGAFREFGAHRRAALWRAEAAWSDDEPLLRESGDEDATVPEAVAPMTPAERLEADFAQLALTAGPHPMTLLREQLRDVWRAADLARGRDGETVRIAGTVICRQRPGTAKGFLFVSLEDETGIANAVVTPDLFAERRLVLTQEPALRVTGRLQRRDGVIHVRAETVEPLAGPLPPAPPAHSFR